MKKEFLTLTTLTHVITLRKNEIHFLTNVLTYDNNNNNNNNNKKSPFSHLIYVYIMQCFIMPVVTSYFIETHHIFCMLKFITIKGLIAISLEYGCMK